MSEEEKKVYEGIKLLPEQIRDAWESVSKINLPKSFDNLENATLLGMGGSALGGRMVKALFEKSLRAPFEICTQIYSPNYVSSKTLVIASSYSGNTEETITATLDAVKKGGQIFVLATGGKLADTKNEHNLEGLIFNPKYNPSNQPRLATGYSLGSILALLAKLNFISITESELDEALKEMTRFSLGLSDYEDHQNIAVSFAKNIKNSAPILVASEHLLGGAHTFKNQLNETAKTFSVLFDLPELNHHLMEGLKHPAQIKEFIKFIFFESDLYSQRIAIRYPITKEVVEKNNVSALSYKLRGTTKLAQQFELLIFSSYVQFYLGRLYQEDPTQIPWVDYFKESYQNNYF